MAYFSNGTEGEQYEEKYCERCIHYGDENKGCPIWDAHLFFSYELCNKENDPGKQILDMLIPMDGVWAGECRMFVEKKAEKCHTLN